MSENINNSQELSNSSPKDQRHFERFPSRFPAKFKDARSDFGTEVYLRDASAAGIKITTKERLYIHDNITLEVVLPDGKGTMTLRGEVVWVRQKDADIWNVGVKFHKVVFMDLWRPFKFIEADSANN